MNKVYFFKYAFLIVVLGVIHITIAKPQLKNYTINVIEEMKLDVLADNFTGKLNPSYWNIIDRGKNYNNELQYYRDQNVSTSDGLLHITSLKEEYDYHLYTSGLINTKGKFEFLYGRIIFRAKPAIGNGLLSAVWLLPADDSFLPEIDIIEVLGEKHKEIWTGVHYLNNFIIDSTFNTTNNENDDFSIFELHWEEEEIRWYINQKLVHKVTKGIPNKSMYLIINLAVGGDWPKEPDDSAFPSSFLIDYIVIMPGLTK